jgi:hypothetical protein
VKCLLNYSIAIVFLIDNIFVFFGGRDFQHAVVISTSINFARLLTNLFLYSYESDFIQQLHKKNGKKLARSFISFSDILSLNNSKIDDFIDHIYPMEIKINDTTYTGRSALYVDVHFEIDSEFRLRKKLYEKKTFKFSYCKFSIHM